MMTDLDSLVILRMDNEKFDIIGTLVAISDDSIALENPFFVDFNPIVGEMAVQPYCALAECNLFEFKRSHMKVMSSVRSGIAKVFIEGIRDINESLDDTYLGDGNELDINYEEEKITVKKDTLH